MAIIEYNSDFEKRYVELAPAALAFERLLECQLYLGRKLEKPVLDVGCGDGLFAKILFKEPVDLGIDPDPSEIALAAASGAYHEVITCFGDAVPKADSSFSTAFSNSVLEHIENIEPVLSEVHRLLKPHGIFIVTIPTDLFERYSLIARILFGLGWTRIGERYCRLYNRFWKHFHYYDPDGWKQLFGSAGFTVLEQSTYAQKNVCTAHDVLTLCALPSLVSKRLFKRWILFPHLRRLWAPLIGRMGRRIRLQEEGDGPGGLCFFVLEVSEK
ncbi:MAG: methyltransferase domain-containing protein [Magnetococcales bacterium]|nr:methyltransferase domain-containing protein [Magnetococcales bacterium]